MNNLSSYCGLVDARISASEKDLPVQSTKTNVRQAWFYDTSVLLLYPLYAVEGTARLVATAQPKLFAKIVVDHVHHTHI